MNDQVHLGGTEAVLVVLSEHHDWERGAMRNEPEEESTRVPLPGPEIDVEARSPLPLGEDMGETGESI